MNLLLSLQSRECWHNVAVYRSGVQSSPYPVWPAFTSTPSSGLRRPRWISRSLQSFNDRILSANVDLKSSWSRRDRSGLIQVLILNSSSSESLNQSPQISSSWDPHKRRLRGCFSPGRTRPQTPIILMSNVLLIPAAVAMISVLTQSRREGSTLSTRLSALLKFETSLDSYSVVFSVLVFPGGKSAEILLSNNLL